MGVVWAEFVTTSIDFLPTSTVKAEAAALLKGPGENTGHTRLVGEYIRY